MDYVDLGKKALFFFLGVLIIWLAISGNLGRGLACIICPGALHGDTTSDGSGSTSTTSTGSSL